jgi:hypothetical protein
MDKPWSTKVRASIKEIMKKGRLIFQPTWLQYTAGHEAYT